MPIAVTRLIRNSVLVRRSWLTDSRVAERAHELIMVRDGHNSSTRSVHNLFDFPVSSDVQKARPWGVIGWGRPWGLHSINIMHVAKDLATRVSIGSCNHSNGSTRPIFGQRSTPFVSLEGRQTEARVAWRCHEY